MRLVEVDGVTIEIDEIPGEKAGFPTLVFLHEGLGSRAQWRDFPRAVCEVTGASGLVYSRQGYGESSPVTLPRPLSFMHDEARDALPALLHTLNLDDVILVGHSDGASIALLYAAARADASTPGARVRGVAVMAPHVFVEPMCVDSIAKIRAEYTSTDLRDRLARYHGKNVDCAFFGWADAWLDPEFRQWNIESCLSKVHAPLLVVQGDSDPYGTLAQVDAIARHVPRVPNALDTLILPGCGHAPHRERPIETKEAIARLVARIASC
jgi:pimeloyl-ACP methyl ester carboxylesterase